MRMSSLCGEIPEEQKFDDALHWEIDEEASETTPKSKNGSFGANDQMPMGNM